MEPPAEQEMGCTAKDPQDDFVLIDPFNPEEQPGKFSYGCDGQNEQAILLFFAHNFPPILGITPRILGMISPVN